MAFQCERCNDLQDGDAYATVVTGAKFVGKTTDIREAEGWCEGCTDDNSFWCDITGNYYTYTAFTSGYYKYGTICIEHAEAAGWTYEDGNEVWYPPNEPTNEELNVSDKPKYIDFYWKLEEGERKGVLMVEDGDEVAMASSLEHQIYHRIEEAGADAGDPAVVNTYTRLELIDQKLLPEDYVL